MDYMFIGGERVIYYKERLRELDGLWLPAEVITDIWSDISIEGLAKEGVKSVDIKGFGRFLFKPHRAVKHINMLKEVEEYYSKKKEEETKPFKIANLELRIEKCKETTKILKSKLI